MLLGFGSPEKQNPPGLSYLMWWNQRGGTFYVWGSSEVDNLGFSYLNNNWHNLAFTYDGSQNIRTIYIDGIMQDAISHNILSNDIINTPVRIGNWLDLGGWQPGPAGASLDDIGIWNTALSSSQVSSLYTLQSAPEPSTYALFGLGAVGLLMVIRKKKAD